MLGVMGSWAVIEAALARRKPPRNQAWLADELGISAQAINAWKSRGVPANRYLELAEKLDLTVKQIAGREPPPWDVPAGWPFPSIDSARFARLTERQKGEIEGEVRRLIESFERSSAGGGSGESSTSHLGASKASRTR